MLSACPLITGTAQSQTDRAGATAQQLSDRAELTRYAYIAGAPYSGSTLLTFLLNAHPSCVSVGELFGLMPNVQSEAYLCSCGAMIQSCPFWLALQARMQADGIEFHPTGFPWPTHYCVSRNRLFDALLLRSLGSRPFDAVRDAVVDMFPSVRRRLTKTGSINAAVARAALALRGVSTFVDGSKIAERIRFLSGNASIDLFVIHLVRDVRGNAFSIMKNTGWTSATRAARAWVKRNREADRMRRHVPEDRWILLRYGDLCADAQSSMDRLSTFLGLAPAPLPDNFRSVEHHLIGNRMRLGGAGDIREDRTWEERLTKSQIREIAAVAGRDNRRWGYDWP